MCVCVVCVSVTLQYCIKTAKHKQRRSNVKYSSFLIPIKDLDKIRTGHLMVGMAGEREGGRRKEEKKREGENGDLQGLVDTPYV